MSKSKLILAVFAGMGIFIIIGVGGAFGMFISVVHALEDRPVHHLPHRDRESMPAHRISESDYLPEYSEVLEEISKQKKNKNTDNEES